MAALKTSLLVTHALPTLLLGMLRANLRSSRAIKRGFKGRMQGANSEEMSEFEAMTRDCGIATCIDKPAGVPDRIACLHK